MSQSDDIKRMEELQTILKEAADAYYNKDTEIMSNYEYDALYDELVELEEKTNVILDDSITHSVGVEVNSSLEKITHSSPMLSLAKTKSREEIQKWLGDKKGCLSWKLDGSTVVLTYEHGKLTQAVTRGNGYIGEDITAQARKFKNVPHTISYDGKLIIRGEALMTYTEFERVNANQPIDEKYKNPRNLASGTMRALDISILDKRAVEFHAFTLVSVDPTPQNCRYDLNSYSQQLDFLDSLGFTSVEHYVVTKDNLITKIDELANSIEQQDIPSDGLVLFFDDVEYGNSLGSTDHAPRNGIAFKWQDETVITELEDILWNTTRTGRVNPIAQFVPVELEGTTVSRATLNNLTFIKDVLGVPFKGQKVKVYKANKIIPTIMTEEKGNGGSDNDFIVPTLCPTCKEELIVCNDHGSEFLMCTNEECPARQESSLVHFCSRDALDIRGLSEKTIRRMKDLGIIDSYTDILDLPDNKNKVIEYVANQDNPEKMNTIYHVEGIKEKTLDNLCSAINNAKNTTAARFLYSLGIREIGKVASKDIMNAYNNNVKALIQDCINNKTEKIANIDGIGDVMMEELVKYIQANHQMITELLNKVTITDAGKVDKKEDNSFVSGKTFVITGDVNIFKNRNEFKEFVEKNGGKVTGSVTKKTDYLVTNTPDSGTSKNVKAQELNIPIITEQEFYDKAGR